MRDQARILRTVPGYITTRLFSGTDRNRESGGRDGCCCCDEPFSGFGSRPRVAENHGNTDERRDARHHHHENLCYRQRCSRCTGHHDCYDSQLFAGTISEFEYNQSGTQFNRHIEHLQSSITDFQTGR